MYKSEIKPKKKIRTKFGTAKIHKNGYYIINSSKEGNHRKYLHRLIWEDWYDKPVPAGYDIHHLNGNKLDNRIQNLQCVEHGAHMRFHKQGENHPLYGKKRSEETKRKMSESHKNHIPTICKTGPLNRRQKYCVKFHGNVYKQSINKDFLEEWLEEHIEEILIEDEWNRIRKGGEYR